MGPQTAINQRDLRMRSREVMDAVEHGESFTVTRDGRPIGELVPLARPRFVSRVDFVAASATAPLIDLQWLREDLDTSIDFGVEDPYDR